MLRGVPDGRQKKNQRTVSIYIYIYIVFFTLLYSAVMVLKDFALSFIGRHAAQFILSPAIVPRPRFPKQQYLARTHFGFSRLSILSILLSHLFGQYDVPVRLTFHGLNNSIAHLGLFIETETLHVPDWHVWQCFLRMLIGSKQIS